LPTDRSRRDPQAGAYGLGARDAHWPLHHDEMCMNRNNRAQKKGGPIMRRGRPFDVHRER
jgi:hypothetical protein